MSLFFPFLASEAPVKKKSPKVSAASQPLIPSSQENTGQQPLFILTNNQQNNTQGQTTVANQVNFTFENFTLIF